MKIALADEMKKIDKKAIEEYGVPEILLMENAGREVAAAFEEYLGGVSGKRICVLAGSGNNGGDAFVAARHLMNHGAQISIFLVGSPAHLTKSAALNRDIIIKMGVVVHVLETERDWDKLQVTLRFVDGVVDGILGTGFKGGLRDAAARVVRMVNGHGKPVIAVDIPTGVEADTGNASPEAIRADLTVTFGLPKFGHMIGAGETATGKLLVDDIGIPKALLEDDTIRQTYLDDVTVAPVLLPRPLDAHKGSCGRILVIAGSRGMTGAAALAASAVLRSGAGVAVLALPESLQEMMAGKLTEVMTKPLPETDEGAIDIAALGEVLSLAEGFDAVLIGPGLGRAQETQKFVQDFCAAVKKPLILDADAIYAFCGKTDAFKGFAFVPILTPHLGEMAHLLELSVDELRASLLDMTREAAREYHAVFVVKSECTVIVYPDGQVFLTSKGNSGMATAGAGDVLAGAIAGLMKQTAAGLAPLAGVYIHGLAGDLSAKEKGYGLIASDILENLPHALCTLL